MPANLAAVDRRAVEEDKKKEVAYVKAEKAGDDTALAKLREKYGDGNKRSDDSIKKRIWNCHECGFRNVDTRDVCGKCLAPALAVLSLEKQEQETNDLIPARGTLDPTTQVQIIGGRAYREFHLPDLDAKKLKAKRAKIEQRQRDEEESRRIIKKKNDDDDDDDGDDEPDCRTGGGKKLGGGNDDDDDEEEEEEDLDHQNENFTHYDYQREEEEFLQQENEEDEDGIQFDKLRQSYILKMSCPSRFWKFIIGTKGKTLQDIQRMTGATVSIPKDEQKNQQDTIDISGTSKSSVVAARLKVEGIILDNQDRVEYTHFLSIPLSVNPNSKAAFASYLQDMTRTCVDEEKRVDPFMFQTPSKIHLTLLMLRLHNEEEMNKAKSLLVVVQEMLREMFYSTAKECSTAKISFKGVNYMNDDPSDVHVLFLDLVRDDTYKKLVDLIQKINSLFIDSGLALPKDVSHNEKLHATVVNSKWRGGDVVDGTLDHFDHHSSGKRAPRVSFDATELLRLFGANGQVLGTHKLERVDLSVLGNGVGADGYYVNVHSAFFP